jgi:hypothetical protein
MSVFLGCLVREIIVRGQISNFGFLLSFVADRVVFARGLGIFIIKYFIPVFGLVCCLGSLVCLASSIDLIVLCGSIRRNTLFYEPSPALGSL